MSAKTAELMMDLLKEMALLKQLDDDYENGLKSSSENIDLGTRKNRRLEIAAQMKALAAPAG